MSIWNSALNMLARREFSRAELSKRLSDKFPEQADEVLLVLDRLQDEGLQSDQRFVDMWFRSQLSKGRGPRRIKQECHGKGVSELVQQAIDDSDTDWYALASEVAQRKFKSAVDPQQQAKIYRFLIYRGFTSDMVRFAISELTI